MKAQLLAEVESTSSPVAAVMTGVGKNFSGLALQAAQTEEGKIKMPKIMRADRVRIVFVGAIKKLEIEHVANAAYEWKRVHFT